MIGLQIQTISTCTSRCFICPHSKSWHNQHPGVMTDKIFNKIMKEVASIKFEKICPYLMNEPLTDPRFFKHLQKIKKLKNFDYIEVATNASLLNSEYANKLITVLEDVNNDIWISFHGVNENNYKEIMGLDFKKTLNNVCNFLVKADGKLKIKIQGSGQPFIQRTNSSNWFNKEEYFDFWNKIFNDLNLTNRPKIFYFQYNDRAGNIRNDLSFNFRRKSLDRFKCNRVDQWLHFLYTGELILCCNDYNKECILGDITKCSLKEILNSTERNEIIDMVEGRKKSPDDFICKRCVRHLC